MNSTTLSNSSKHQPLLPPHPHDLAAREARKKAPKPPLEKVLRQMETQSLRGTHQTRIGQKFSFDGHTGWLAAKPVTSHSRQPRFLHEKVMGEFEPTFAFSLRDALFSNALVLSRRPEGEEA